jgi:hypothetical protein
MKGALVRKAARPKEIKADAVSIYVPNLGCRALR